MPLLESTKSIIASVEQVTNRPVYVTEDPSLTVLARIQIARNDAPMHALRYRPLGSAAPDYFIACECGFVLRLYQTPPDKRFDFSPAAEGASRMEDLLRNLRGTPSLLTMRDHLLQALGTQLRSIPVGLRVDQWISEEYPALKVLQEQGVRKQLSDNVKVLSPEVKNAFPAKVFTANASMNAAMAAYWARTWGDNSVTLPYKLAGLLDRGLGLLKIADQTSAEPVADCSLVDAWAFELGLKGWFRWIPHKVND